jgi:hypothetical protein
LENGLKMFPWRMRGSGMEKKREGSGMLHENSWVENPAN